MDSDTPHPRQEKREHESRRWLDIIAARFRVLPFVYCAESWKRATIVATLTLPITCPPTTADTLDLRLLTMYPILYFNLHGYENIDEWYGEAQDGERPVALRPGQVKSLHLDGKVVFAENCYGGSGAMRDAFLNAGARAFVGANQEAYGRIGWRPDEADLLGGLFLHLLPGRSVGEALETAKRMFSRLKLDRPDKDDRITLAEFSVYGDADWRLA